MAIEGFKYYHYDPSMVAAVIFIALFVTTTFLHSYQLLRTKAWIMIPFTVGGFFQWVGYIGRAVGSNQSPNWTLVPYIIQALLILVAPALFAASIYMQLSRIIALADGESHALIKKKWLTKIFVCGDVASFFLQAGGGGIQSSGSASSVKTGSNLIVGGLFVQLIFFGVFIAVAIHFDLVMNKAPTARAQSEPWRKHLVVLYVASVLIMVRSIFRVVEYLQGFDGYLLSHEPYLYVFDAVPMFAVMVIFNVVHPSEVVALVEGGKMAKMGVKMEAVVGYRQHERVASGNSGRAFV